MTVAFFNEGNTAYISVLFPQWLSVWLIFCAIEKLETTVKIEISLTVV